MNLLKVGDFVILKETGARVEILKLPTKSVAEHGDWRQQYITLEIRDDKPRIWFYFRFEFAGLDAS